MAAVAARCDIAPEILAGSFFGGTAFSVPGAEAKPPAAKRFIGWPGWRGVVCLPTSMLSLPTTKSFAVVK